MNMSLLRLSSSSLRVAARSARPQQQQQFVIKAQRAGFRAAAARAAGKESSVHDAQRKQEIDAAKHEELAKQKQGKNEFRSEIASDSEEAVKADQGELDASKDGIKELQEKTKGQ